MVDLKTMKGVCSPTVHSNGTIGEVLIKEVDSVIEPLRLVVENLKNMTVHCRDYYVQENPDLSFFRAREQSKERYKQATELLNELIVYRHKIKSQLNK
jgi:hypothetical protein